MQHQPDDRERVLKSVDAQGNEIVFKVTLPPGMEIDPLTATSEAKPQPTPADDPRPAFHRNVGGPYGTA
jgi:hypothetical protein